MKLYHVIAYPDSGAAPTLIDVIAPDPFTAKDAVNSFLLTNGSGPAQVIMVEGDLPAVLAEPSAAVIAQN